MLFFLYEMDDIFYLLFIIALVFCHYFVFDIIITSVITIWRGIKITAV